RAAPAEVTERPEASLGVVAERVQALSWERPSRGAIQVDEPEPSGESAEPIVRSGRGARSAREVASVASLNEEVALLDRARSAVRAGHPADALTRLDEHSARFPKGSLALEAQVLRVQALAAAGRTEEA